MAELVTSVFDYDNEISIISRGGLDQIMTLKDGVTARPMELLSMEYATGKLVRYNSAGSGGTNIPLTFYTGTTDAVASGSDEMIPVLVPNSRVNRASLNGIDYTADFEEVAILFSSGIILEEVR